MAELEYVTALGFDARAAEETLKTRTKEDAVEYLRAMCLKDNGAGWTPPLSVHIGHLSFSNFSIGPLSNSRQLDSQCSGFGRKGAYRILRFCHLEAVSVLMAA